jgi:hypothetical protein
MVAVTAPVRIIADDAGLQAPTKIGSGMRHILFQNHGKEIHEAMFVKLQKGMTAAGYQAQVRAGSSSPKARSTTPARG